MSEKEKSNVKNIYYNESINYKIESFYLTDYIILTEYLKNGDICELIKKNTKMNPNIRSKIIFGVATIIKQLHKRNIIHDNLNTNNILLDDSFEPKISSFELSIFDNDPVYKDTGTGTPVYMAPEVFNNEYGTYSFPSDVFSYAVLYAMFSNHKFEFSDKKKLYSCSLIMIKINQGNRYRRLDNIPDHYWELNKSMLETESRREANILKDNKFALEKFGMETDLTDLHEYQNRINIE